MTNAPLMLRSEAADTVVRQHFTVTGVVQGVGFRPFVHRIASELGLAGFVGNDSGAVFLEVQGEQVRVAEFGRRLRVEAPPLARITDVCVTDLAADHGSANRLPDCRPARRSPVRPRRFRRTSRCATTVWPSCSTRATGVTGTRSSPVPTAGRGSPSSASCRTTARPPPCRHSPCASDALPNTTIRRIADSTRSRSPAPSAGRRCGSSQTGGGSRNGRRAGRDPTSPGRGCGDRHQRNRRLPPCLPRRRRGGGRHATRTKEPAAPSPSPCWCVTSVSRAATPASTTPRPRCLSSAARPIVLLRRRPDAPVAEAVAPGSPLLGLMLPYSPIHRLLLAAIPGAAEPVPDALVLTSANRSDEPICFTDDDVALRLPGLCDAILDHDRPIHVPCDDSVVRIIDRRPPSCRSAGPAAMRRSRST